MARTKKNAEKAAEVKETKAPEVQAPEAPAAAEKKAPERAYLNTVPTTNIKECKDGKRSRVSLQNVGPNGETGTIFISDKQILPPKNPTSKSRNINLGNPDNSIKVELMDMNAPKGEDGKRPTTVVEMKTADLAANWKESQSSYFKEMRARDKEAGAEAEAATPAKEAEAEVGA